MIAAVFLEAGAADRVRARLSRRFALDGDLRVAPFGAAGSDQSSATTVLAGRLREDRVAEAQAMIEADGGLIVSNVDELWTGQVQVPRLDDT